jgi:hypothetical protein
MMKKVQFYMCPNPECQKAFENLILIYNKSEDQPEKFYGCPYCFLKLDPTVIDTFKKIEKIVEKPDTIPSLEEEISDCPHYFGYLAKNFASSIITKHCLDCKKMDNCMKNIKEDNI